MLSIVNHRMRLPASLLTILQCLLLASLPGCAALGNQAEPTNPKAEAAISPAVAAQFESAIADKLISSVDYNPWLDKSESIKYLDRLRKVNSQLTTLNQAQLTTQQKQRIKQLFLTESYITEKIAHWNSWNHLQLLNHFLPELVFERLSKEELEQHLAKIDWQGNQLRALGTQLEQQSAVGFRYPTLLLEDARKFVSALSNPPQANASQVSSNQAHQPANPFKARIQQMLSYSPLSATEQGARAEKLNRIYTNSILPAVKELADRLDKIGSNTAESDQGAIKLPKPYRPDNVLSANQLELTQLQSRLSELNQSMGRTAKDIYLDPEFRLNQIHQEQMLLDLVSIHIEEFQAIKSVWKTHQEPEWLLSYDNQLLFNTALKAKDTLLLNASTFLQVPVFEWQTLAYLAAASDPGPIPLEASAIQRGIGLFMIDLLNEKGLFTDKMNQYGLLQHEILENLMIIAEHAYLTHVWTEQQVIDYLQSNAPYSNDFIKAQVSWLFAHPGLLTRSHEIHRSLAKQWQAYTDVSDNQTSFYNKLTTFMKADRFQNLDAELFNNL